MDFKKILNTITSEKGEEILNELKEKGGSLTDMLQDKLQDTLKGKGELIKRLVPTSLQIPSPVVLRASFKAS